MNSRAKSNVSKKTRKNCFFKVVWLTQFVCSRRIKGQVHVQIMLLSIINTKFNYLCNHSVRLIIVVLFIPRSIKENPVKSSLFA